MAIPFHPATICTASQSSCSDVLQHHTALPVLVPYDLSITKLLTTKAVMSLSTHTVAAIPVALAMQSQRCCSLHDDSPCEESVYGLPPTQLLLKHNINEGDNRNSGEAFLQPDCSCVKSLTGCDAFLTP